MEKAKLSRRIATIKYNHEFMITPLNRMHLLPKRIQVGSEQWSLDQLGIKAVQTDTFVVDKSVELMVCWLRLNITALSKPAQELWAKCLELSNKDALVLLNNQGALMKQIYSEVMKFRKSGDQKVVGISLYLRERPDYAMFLLAWRLATYTHPFVHYILGVISRYRGANGLDFINPTKIMAKVDFPCSSIANILTALGINYVRNLEYIDLGWILTTYGDQLYTIYYNADPSYFKCGSLEAMNFLLSHKLVEQEVTRDEAFMFGLSDFSNGG